MDKVKQAWIVLRRPSYNKGEEKEGLRMDAEAMGKRIAQLRKARNLTQQQLADQLNVTNRAICPMGTGRGLSGNYAAAQAGGQSGRHDG